MPYLATASDIIQLQEALPEGLFSNNHLAKEETSNGNPWLALLSQFTRENDDFESRSRRLRSQEATKPNWNVQKVAPGPWRSLGGVFDYSDWPDRERFLELDRAIAAAGFHDEEEQISGLLPAA